MRCGPPESMPDPPRGDPPRGTIDPEKNPRVPRAIRWLRALLRAVYRNDGDTHHAVTFGSCPGCRVSHSPFRRRMRQRPIRITNGTRVYSIIVSRSVTSIRSIDRECENVHSKRTRKRKTSLANKSPFNQSSFVRDRDRAVHILTCRRSEHYFNTTLSHSQKSKCGGVVVYYMLPHEARIGRIRNYDLKSTAGSGGEGGRRRSTISLSIDHRITDQARTSGMTATRVEG